MTAPAPLAVLVELARQLHGRHRLEVVLERVVEAAATITRTGRASLRLLDPTGTELVAVARAGEPLHLDAAYPFRRDEGFLGWIVSNVASIRSDDPTADVRFVRRPDMKPMGAFLGVPVVSGQICLGALSAVAERPGHFDDADEAHLTLLAAIAAPYLEVARLGRLARVDPLTGALTRHGLDEAPPQRDPLSILYVDVDHFRALNDAHGHAAGDEALRTVTRVLGGLVRRDDAVVRWGGEELVVILAGVDLATATRIADRARRAIAYTEVATATAPINVTVSIGVAERRPGQDLAGAIERAERAMRDAKDAGRDRISVAGG